MIPRKVNRHGVRDERELLVGLQLDFVPAVALDRVTLDRVEALADVFAHLLLHELVVHAAEDEDEFVVPRAAAEVVARLVHICFRHPFRLLIEVEGFVAGLNGGKPLVLVGVITADDKYIFIIDVNSCVPHSSYP